MKTRTLVASLLAAAAASAQAQSVTLHGTVDGAIEYLNHVGPAGQSLRRMPSITGSTPSRWGLRGSEDLGDGLKAVFALERGFFLNSGGGFAQGGRPFGREAFVGLSGPWGLFSLGRQYTMLSWAIRDANVTGTNIYGSASMDSYIPNARAESGRDRSLLTHPPLRTGRAAFAASGSSTTNDARILAPKASDGGRSLARPSRESEQRCPHACACESQNRRRGLFHADSYRTQQPPRDGRTTCGSGPAFAAGHEPLSRPLQPGVCFFHDPLPPHPTGHLAASLPQHRGAAADGGVYRVPRH